MSDIRHFAYRPSGILRRYVREILWVHSAHEREQILLPETNLSLVLRQSGKASLGKEVLPDAIVSGLQAHIRKVKHEKKSSLIIVRFSELGAGAFLREHVDRLYNQTTSLDCFINRQKIEDIQNILVDAPDLQQQILHLESFLLRNIQEQGKSPLQLAQAVEMIRATQGRASITSLARHSHMTQSTLERHFRSAVGTSPKMFSRLVRLQHVCQLWDDGKNLTQIAVEAGYSDQPHLIRDFRLFTGISPEEFFHTVSPRNLPIFYK